LLKVMFLYVPVLRSSPSNHYAPFDIIPQE
jgi:hypothetical protein